MGRAGGFPSPVFPFPFSLKGWAGSNDVIVTFFFLQPGGVFLLVGILGGAATNCGRMKFLKNLRFKKQGIGWGAREYGVNTA